MTRWNFLKIVAACIFYALFGMTSGFGQAPQPQNDADSVVIVEAKGVGESPDSALKAAIRGAVEQAIGTMVDTETVVKNDAVISDKILSYSGGYVVKSEQIGEPRKSEDGLITVRIKAQVQKNNLRNKLSEEKIIASKIDGESLFAEAISKTDEKDRAKEFIDELFSKCPSQLFKTEIFSKPYYDIPKERAHFVVKVSLVRAKYDSYVEKIKKILSNISDDQQKVAGKQNENAGNDIFFSTRKKEPGNGVYLLDSASKDLRNSQWDYYGFNKFKWDSILKPEWASSGFVRRFWFDMHDSMALKVSLIDNLNNPLWCDVFKIHSLGFMYRGKKQNSIFVAPFVGFHDDGEFNFKFGDQDAFIGRGEYGVGLQTRDFYIKTFNYPPHPDIQLPSYFNPSVGYILITAKLDLETLKKVDRVETSIVSGFEEASRVTIYHVPLTYDVVKTMIETGRFQDEE